MYYFIGDIFMNEENLIKYYNKFNEDKRLNTRHGQVEFITSMKYIKEYLKELIKNMGLTCNLEVKKRENGKKILKLELNKSFIAKISLR